MNRKTKYLKQKFLKKRIHDKKFKFKDFSFNFQKLEIIIKFQKTQKNIKNG